MRIPFNVPYYTGKELDYMKEALETRKISGDGTFTRRINEYIEENFGTKKALFVTSGSSALDMAALLIDIKPGDEVIMPSYTFVSTANSVVLRGAKVVFADIDSNTMNINPEDILFGNGAADIIFRLCYALKPKAALLLAPTFSEYEQALVNINSGISYYRLRPENDFAVDMKILENIKGKDIVFICNPNNPTGMVTDKELIYKICERCWQENCYLVVDECFMDFVSLGPNNSFKEYLKDFENVIILKAFTKIFAMAGLRLGYCLCHNKEIISKIEKAGQPWSVSVPAQIAGVAALGNRDYLTETVAIIETERVFLTEGLRKLGFTVFKSNANFFLFKTKEKDLYEKLFEKGILIRKCSNFMGLDNTYYRIAVKCREDNEKLLEAIRGVV
jgi:histidinol-phosphate aminotransferase